jgi:hypothetical protein
MLGVAAIITARTTPLVPARRIGSL